MIKITLNLPKYRLHLSLAKRRGGSVEEPLFPEFETIKNFRAGNKISRYFRHIFEHKDIRKLLGTNLALVLIASSFAPTNVFADAEAEQNVVGEASTPLVTERSAQYPTESVRITQGYRLFHPGIDLDGETGDPIRPIKAGRVEAISRSKYAYGNAVVIDHGNKITSLYAHLSKILVVEGQEVTTNTVIGEMGATGRASGDHLHLEIRDHGVAVNPITILPR
ncbi:MAG TPA: M23 family metallopeptidase [Patescibacteria group bacterium]|nr:M23 family metallopeptidase [Patescibacteria group bacterium]